MNSDKEKVKGLLNHIGEVADDFVDSVDSHRNTTLIMLEQMMLVWQSVGIKAFLSFEADQENIEISTFTRCTDLYKVKEKLDLLINQMEGE